MLSMGCRDVLTEASRKHCSLEKLLAVKKTSSDALGQRQSTSVHISFSHQRLPQTIPE
jgi:hypothetical protein